ncbi:hypothetical protein [Pseudescherichia sp.]|uniref:hypothetical protein n=1 Tax=Pseudescherichia sp. TaxID=2055881 RepID=UPI002897374C|nr:hypothetical protein [Pseudescherichia sp.]
MSWDNVSDIKNIKIWTDYSDSTQGHLFVNDNHQLKLNVGISFTLKNATTEGPTEDEVYSALSLIDNQDSGPLKYLTVVTENTYTAVYDPYHAESVTTDGTDDVDDGLYDFLFTYNVSSPTSLNAECYFESVALKLEYTVTNSDGTTSQVIKETSVKGNYYTKTYVSVTCYPAKLYGMEGQNRTSLKSVKTVVSGATYHNGNYDNSGDTSYSVAISIDDSYFKLFYLNGAQEPDALTTLQPLYINHDYDSPMWDKIYNSFFPNIQCGEKSYTIIAEVRSNLSYDTYPKIFDANIPINQKEGQIIFAAVQTDVKSTGYNWNSNTYQYLRAYDQFGNSMYIVIAFNNNDYNYIKSVS